MSSVYKDGDNHQEGTITKLYIILPMVLREGVAFFTNGLKPDAITCFEPRLYGSRGR